MDGQWYSRAIGKEGQLFCGTADPQAHLFPTCANSDVEAPEKPNNPVATVFDRHFFHPSNIRSILTIVRFFNGGIFDDLPKNG
jgi:hypothetical protein